MATLYCAEHVHVTQTRTRIPTPYFCIEQESESESLPVSESGNVNEPVDYFVTGRKQSLRRLCFCTCLSVHKRGCLHPGRGFHLGELERPPPIGYYGIRSTSRRYASYWNAFLFCTYLTVILISASVTRSFQILDPYRSTILFTVSSSFPRSLKVKVGTKFRKMWLQSVFLDCRTTTNNKLP